MRVSTLHVQGLLEGLRVCGYDSARFVERAGIASSIVQGAIGWVDGAELERLCELVLDFTGDEAFGLRWGSAQFSQFDLGRVAMYAESLRVAVDRLGEFQRHLAERPELVVDTSDKVARFTVQALASSPRARRMRDEFAASALMQLFAHFGVRDRIVGVDFTHAAPDHASAYRAVWPAPVRFAQPSTCVLLPREVLETANRTPNRVMLGGLRELAQTLLPTPSGPQLLVNRLRLLITSTWPTPPKLSESARLLETSERTLRRVLEREGQSYSRLVQDAKIERAERLLLASTLSIKEIASEVGFQSATAFQRAFKRRTGLTPVGFRASHLAELKPARGASQRGP